jgi:hypothetical protein
MDYTIERKKLESEKSQFKKPITFTEKCQFIENAPEIKFHDHSKNHENFYPEFKEKPNRAEELKQLEKLELTNIKKLGLFQTDEQIKIDIDSLIENGTIAQNQICDENFSPVSATDHKNNPLKWPKTRDEWLGYSNLCLKLVEKLRRNEIRPNWALVKYRSEEEFRVGSFHLYVSIWLVTINQLPCDEIKHRTYTLIHKGVNLFRNQANISRKNALKYRNHGKLCTGITTDYQSLKIKNLLNNDLVQGNNYKICGIRQKTIVNYPMLKSPCRKTKIPFFQKISKRTNLNAKKITAQILEWLETKAVVWLGPANKIESPIRAGLVLAINTKQTPEGEKLKLRVCMDGGPWTIT